MSDDPSHLESDESVGIRKTLGDLTYKEAHLAIMGFYSGFTAVRPKPRLEPTEQMKAMGWEYNKWYWQGAYTVGYLVKVATVGLLVLLRGLGYDLPV